jgi:hypothetical protein
MNSYHYHRDMLYDNTLKFLKIHELRMKKDPIRGLDLAIREAASVCEPTRGKSTSDSARFVLFAFSNLPR